MLLRGINLGARNRLSMKELRTALEAEHFGDVRTHLQSGNIVLSHDGNAEDVWRLVGSMLIDGFGLDVEPVVRTASAWRRLIAGDPFSVVRTDSTKHFVVFCSEKPRASLLPDAEPPERLVARGKQVHVWAPAGMKESRTMGALGRKPPAQVTTFRNWRTVEAVAELL